MSKDWNSSVHSRAAACKTFTAAGTTSPPIPSPGINAMQQFFIVSAKVHSNNLRVQLYCSGSLRRGLSKVNSRNHIGRSNPR